jgi:predicted nucleic acid-binding protein
MEEAIQPTMDSSILGLVVDSSTLIAAERNRVDPALAIETIRAGAGHAPIAISAWTIAELAHGIYRANTSERRQTSGSLLTD